MCSVYDSLRHTVRRVKVGVFNKKRGAIVITRYLTYSVHQQISSQFAVDYFTMIIRVKS